MSGSRKTLVSGGLLLAVWAGLSGGAAFAQAVTTLNFDFNFVSLMTPDGNYGELKATAAATGGPGLYTLTSMSGTLGGASISMLAPNAFAGNDNTVSFPASTNYFTLGGVSFVANNIDYNLYNTAGATGITTVNALNYGGVYSGSVTLVGAPGPVPGAGLFSLGGLCLGGLASRFKLCMKIGRDLFQKLRFRVFAAALSARRALAHERGEENGRRRLSPR